ncbi:MAG: class I tRNA ligase family protein, partial [Pseudonocardiaceae bacterium]
MESIPQRQAGGRAARNTSTAEHTGNDRFRMMKGFHVPRRAGWDCHGLPVEIAVEKELGLSDKQDIEKIGMSSAPSGVEILRPGRPLARGED